MANMSYCRFENTLTDLEDCQEALSESGLGGLSESERRAAIRLIEVCNAIVSENSGEVQS